VSAGSGLDNDALFMRRSHGFYGALLGTQPKPVVVTENEKFGRTKDNDEYGVNS
jgi:hypothetical protein